MEKRGHDNDYLLRVEKEKREVKTKSISPASGFCYKIPLRRNGVLKPAARPPCGRLKTTRTRREYEIVCVCVCVCVLRERVWRCVDLAGP